VCCFAAFSQQMSSEDENVFHDSPLEIQVTRNHFESAKLNKTNAGKNQRVSEQEFVDESSVCSNVKHHIKCLE
jgi:hypothetical protein